MNEQGYVLIAGVLRFEKANVLVEKNICSVKSERLNGGKKIQMKIMLMSTQASLYPIEGL